MRRFFFSLLISLWAAGSLLADENIRAAQERLKRDGFYFGATDGVYNSDVGAAITRYQIRHGLTISGQLDAETTKSLGLATAAQPNPKPPFGFESKTWRRLRESDERFLKQLKNGEIPPPALGSKTLQASSGPAAAAPPAPAAQLPAEHEPAPPAAGPGDEATASKPPLPPAAAPAQPEIQSPPGFSNERIRDYVGAFVLAGIDPQIGSELEFFAGRVDYFDQGVINQQKLRRDLENYARRWPERRFWIAGEIQVEPQTDGKVKVTFPLRYELRSGSRSSTGEVQKTLTLQQAGNDLEIVSVRERKSK